MSIETKLDMAIPRHVRKLRWAVMAALALVIQSVASVAVAAQMLTDGQARDLAYRAAGGNMAAQQALEQAKGTAAGDYGLGTMYYMQAWVLAKTPLLPCSFYEAQMIVFPNTKQCEQSLAYLKSAIAEGSVAAMSDLGGHYYQIALQMIVLKRYVGGSAKSMADMTKMVCPSAISLLQRASAKHDGTSEQNLATLRGAGVCFKKNEDVAISESRVACRDGNADGCSLSAVHDYNDGDEAAAQQGLDAILRMPASEARSDALCGYYHETGDDDEGGRWCADETKLRQKKEAQYSVWSTIDARVDAAATAAQATAQQ